MKTRMKITSPGSRLLPLLMACALTASCGDGATDPADELRGGVLATFSVNGERFRVWITDETAIRQVLDLRDGLSQAHIPNAPIHRGPGPGAHNEPYGWHLDGEEIRMAELAIEVCDGRPSYVEENVGEYVDNVGRYCPWGAELVEVEDRR